MYNRDSENFARDLTDIIRDFLSSERRSKMLTAYRYYRNKTDIDNKNFNRYYGDGQEKVNKSKSNEKMHSNYTKKVVEQAVSYISGVELTSENTSYLESLKNVLGDDFFKRVTHLHRKARQQGVSGLYSYVNANGEFDYTTLKGDELIFIYDSSREAKLLFVIRVYKFDYINDNNETTVVYRAEVVDDEKTTFYQQDDDQAEYRLMVEEIELSSNPVYHWTTINSLTKKTVSRKQWDKVPITEVMNNPDKIDDLQDIKGYIDALEVVSSGFVNDLVDVRQVLWAIRGFEGEDPAQAQESIQTFSVLLLDAEQNTGIEAKTIEIPVQARVTLMEWLDKKIYEMSSSVNMHELKSSNLTTVLIKAHYNELENKVKLVELELRTAINDLIAHASKFMGEQYDPNEIKITFKYNQIFNIIEIMKSLSEQGVRLSQRTLLENHPFVSNVDEEIERLKDEEEAMMENYNNDLPEVGDTDADQDEE